MSAARVLVTGGTGFLGHSLVAHLAAAGRPIRALVRANSDTRQLRELGVELAAGDVCDAATVTAALRGCRYVVHAAGLFRFWGAARDFERTNVEGTACVLEAALRHGVERLVHVSTLAVVGTPPLGGMIDEATPCRPADPYQRSKLDGENLVRMYHQTVGLPAVILRPGAFYGPWGRYAFNRLFFEDPLKGLLIQVHRGRRVTFPAFVPDVARACAAALTAGQPGETYNVSGASLTHHAVNQTISRLAGLPLTRLNVPAGAMLALARWSTRRAERTGQEPYYPLGLAGYVFNDWNVSSAKAQAELGFEATRFEAGARQTLEWYWEAGLFRRRGRLKPAAPRPGWGVPPVGGGGGRPPPPRLGGAGGVAPAARRPHAGRAGADGRRRAGLRTWLARRAVVRKPEMSATKIVTVEQMRTIEAAADQAGVSYAMMMDAAGQAVAEHVLARLPAPADRRVVVLCGAGNNGGDGLVAAHRLAEAGATVAVYATKPLDENDPKVQRLREKGLLIADAENDQRWRVLKNLMGGVTVLVDAIFGTGVRLPLKGRPADLLRQVARYLAGRPGERPLVVAVDCPSGLNCDTGDLDAAALPADVTVTFAAVKPGHLRFPGAEAVGELALADIGLDGLGLPELDDVPLELATADAVQALLPARPRNAHKGTFGRVLVAAGSVNYTGAAYLAGAAAYRVGAGLVTLAVPEPLHAILAGQLPEATWLLLPHVMGVISGSGADMLREAYARTQALLVGPGFGLERETAVFMRRWLGADEPSGGRRGRMGFTTSGDSLANTEPAAAVPPLVVDADGLKLMSKIEDWAARLPRETVLTPHPGEMTALTGLKTDEIEADRVGVAQRYARAWGHVVVLKGAFTVVAAPGGQTTIQPFATPALARAGTGDVLAGTIAGLLAQGLTAYTAAVAGAYLHGLAGVLAAQALGSTASVLAGDVLEGLIEAMAQLQP